MRCERSLIASVVLLVAGLSLIFGYCHGVTSLSAGYPLSNSALHLDFTTTGPGVPGGIALTVVGVLLLVWALCGAIVGEITRFFHRSEEAQSPARNVN